MQQQIGRRAPERGAGPNRRVEPDVHVREPLRQARWLWSALLSCAGVGLSPLAGAAELNGEGPLAGASMQLTTNFDLRFHQVPERLPGFEDSQVLNYTEQVLRNNLLISKPGLVVGVQLDEAAFFRNDYYLDDVLTTERPLYEAGMLSPFDHALVRLEKVYVAKRWGDSELTLGDAYASFGRGIALSLIKNTGIDIDTSIRGARAEARVGNIDITAVTGLTNPQDVSMFNPNRGITKDQGHMVTGAEVEVFGLGPATLSGHGVVYRFARTEDIDSNDLQRYAEGLDAVAAGATLNLAGIGGIDAFVEGDVFDYRAEEMAGDGEGGRLPGYAGYFSAAAYPGKATLLIEGKHTRNTEVMNAFSGAEGWEIVAAPTLEYEMVITEDASSTVNSNDVSAGRVRLDYAVAPRKFIPYVSFAGFRDREVGGEHFNTVPETIGHGIVGWQLFKGRWVFQVNSGYRHDQRDDPAMGADRMAHLDAELNIPLGESNALEFTLNGRRFWWGVNPLQQSDFLEMNNAVAYHLGQKWAFLIYQDFTNNPIITTQGNLSFIDPSSYGQERDSLYGAFEVMVHPRPSSTLRLFYGAYKAGIRCAGGQCRTLPGFEGARVTWQATF